MKKLIYGLAIFLGIFIITAVSITYVSIKKANEPETENVQIVEQDNKIERGIDLYGTYNQNDLIVKEVIEEHNGVEVKIPQIEGLKDTNVQNRINKELYNTVQEMIAKQPNINYGIYHVRSNFANVLSISYHIGLKADSEQVYLNYNLVNGEKLKLEDLFIKDTDITQIVRSSFYEAMISDSFTGENVVVSPDETELYKIVKNYMNNPEKVFAFSPAQIYFYYDNHVASVKMTDIADKVSIYTKYLTDESLFVRDDIGFKNIFTCVEGNYEIFENIEYGYLEDNFWYDITVWNYYDEDAIGEEKQKAFADFKDNTYKEIDKEVEEYRKIAKDNPDKFYIFLSKPNINVYSNSKYSEGRWSHTYSNAVTVNKNIRVLEMPYSFYENTYKDKLIEAYRYEYFLMAGGAYLYGDEAEGDIIITHNNEFKLYNYITGGEITKLEDVFYENSNYMEIIKNKTKASLIEKYNYTDKEANLLIEKINCKLDGTQVNATVEGLDDFMVIIYFNNFDTSVMKIF